MFCCCCCENDKHFSKCPESLEKKSTSKLPQWKICYMLLTDRQCLFHCYRSSTLRQCFAKHTRRSITKTYPQPCHLSRWELPTMQATSGQDLQETLPFLGLKLRELPIIQTTGSQTFTRNFTIWTKTYEKLCFIFIYFLCAFQHVANSALEPVSLVLRWSVAMASADRDLGGNSLISPCKIQFSQYQNMSLPGKSSFHPMDPRGQRQTSSG